MGPISFIQVCGIYELCGPIVCDPSPSVNMPENMYPGFLRLHGMKQVFASEVPFARCGLVEDPERWAVCDKDVQSGRDLVPVSLCRRPTRIHESPMEKLWRVRRAPERQIAEPGTGVFQVEGIGQKCSCLLRIEQRTGWARLRSWWSSTQPEAARQTTGSRDGFGVYFGVFVSLLTHDFPLITRFETPMW
jgi:hypothetical protein